MFSLFGRKPRAARTAPPGQRQLYIPESLYRKMIYHCQEERPLEACGLMVGVGGQVTGVFATDNEHRSPVIYKVDERQLLYVFQEIHKERQEIIAIYHSHVRTEPVPSKTDIAQATWPEAFYVIVSLALRQPTVRAWRIVDGQVTEHQVVVQPDSDGVWRDLRQAVKAASEQDAKPTDTSSS